MVNNRFTPGSWLTVLLAAFPGLLLVFSRVNLMQLGTILPRLVTFGYLAILVIGAPLIWYRRRRFPVWALVVAGFLLWEAVFLAGSLLAQFLSDLGWLPGMWQDGMLGYALVEVLMIVGLSVLLLRGQRLSTAVWLTIAFIVVVNLLAFFYYKSIIPAWMVPVIVQFLSNSSIGLLDGLMLVAAGLLAVRQHGTLAMLVVIGGFGYMCLDSDFISGFRLNEWAWYTVYVVSMYGLYLVVTPVALLRARTRLGRLLAVFIPVGIFLIARIAVPDLVLPGPHLMPWGDILLSINVMLIFMAWVLSAMLTGHACRER
jgi:hypothetical protein